MAINKLVAINNGSTPVSGDWARLVEYQNAFMRQVNSGQIITDGVYLKQGSYIQHGGVLYRVDDEDYTILGSLTASVFNYIVIEDNGTGVLTATWATDISGYNWNYIYSELLAGDESGVLPYAERDGIVRQMIQKKILAVQELLTDSNVTFNRVQIDDTTDITPTSTTSPFQIGKNGNENLAFDANQIMRRDGSGGLLPLFINADGTTIAPVQMGAIMLKNLWYSTNDVDHGDVFDKFDALIPDNGDILALSGSAGNSGELFILNFIVRESSTTMYLYRGSTNVIANTATANRILITKNSSTLFSQRIQVAY